MRLNLFILFLFTCLQVTLFAAATVTPASGGENLSPTSVNVSGGWATLGNMIITEQFSDDIAAGQTNTTLILSAPNNWVFNSDVGSVTGTGDLNDIVVPAIIVTSTHITITISTSGSGNSGTNEIDVLTISGIQVQPVDPGLAPSQGNILRTDGTATITGVDGTDNFGTLSLDESNPLPVELTSFSAVVKDNSVNLDWITETEVNSYGFEIQRSGKIDRWEGFEFVEGHGNSNSPKRYNFIDSKVITGSKYSYRLKMIDNDGSYEYSKTIEVNFGVPTEINLSQNYPNPFNPSTTISFTLPESGNVSLNIFNPLGEHIATLVNGYTESGVHTFNFNAENIPSGMYIYQLNTASNTITKKMLFLK